MTILIRLVLLVTVLVSQFVYAIPPQERSNRDCEDVTVEVDGIPFLNGPESLALGDEIIKMAEVFCSENADDYIFYNIEVRVKSLGNYCAFAGRDSGWLLNLGATQPWKVADLTRCIVEIVERHKLSDVNMGGSGHCLLAALAFISVEQYADFFNQFKLLHPSDLENLDRFAWHAKSMQTDFVDQQAACDFSNESKNPRPPKTREI